MVYISHTGHHSKTIHTLFESIEYVKGLIENSYQNEAQISRIRLLFFAMNMLNDGLDKRNNKHLGLTSKHFMIELNHKRF